MLKKEYFVFENLPCIAKAMMFIVKIKNGFTLSEWVKYKQVDSGASLSSHSHL